jgi:DNA-binding PadR family transcriptional regulator
MNPLHYVLLAGIEAAPSSGYDLTLWLANLGQHFWAAEHSSIYPALQQLQTAASLPQELMCNGGTRLYYSSPGANIGVETVKRRYRNVGDVRRWRLPAINGVAFTRSLGRVVHVRNQAPGRRRPRAAPGSNCASGATAAENNA